MEDLKTKLMSFFPVRSVGCLYARVMTSPRFALVLLVSALVWEFGILFIKASGKIFWYDELLTFHVSSIQPFSLLWKALQAGADGMPPGYYVIVQLARMLPGDPHVTLRLPSIFGYILTLLGVYLFTRKRLPELAGLIAVVLITLSPFRAYALEARSYSLLVGFLAISAVLWQRIDEKRFMIPLFALFLTLAVSCHYLAVVTISCFGIAELTWTILSRRIRWGVWAACVLATTPFFLSLPILLHYRDVFGENFWSRPIWYTAVETYKSYYLVDGIRPTLVLIFFFGIMVCDSLLRMFRKPRKTSHECDFSPPEITLVGSFLFYPALLVLLTKLFGSGYTSRYGWPVILGLVLGSVYVFRTIWLKPYSTQLLGALLIVFALQGGLDFSRLSKASSSGLNERWIRLAELSRDEAGIPVVIGSAVEYLEATKYAPPELRDRLVQVFDADIAVRLVGCDTADKSNRSLAHFIPLRVEDIAPFQAAHRRFILYSGGTIDWITPYLIERKYRLRLFSKDSVGAVWSIEKGLFSIYIVEHGHEND
jgi:hypothetical protein